MTDLQGKTALVTGASRGIGRAIAERLAAAGAVVGVNYARDEKAAKEVVETITAAGGRAFAVHAELGADGDVESLFEAFDAGLREHVAEPRLDILVNNAGITAMAAIEDVTPDLYDQVFAVNTRALFFTTQKALTRMPDGGRIINVTSGVTRVSFPEGIAYAMTKGAIDTFTLALAKQVGPRGITVNNVAPGFIDTDVNAHWLRDNPEGQAYAASRAAVARVGLPEDVSGAVAFLASDAASFITGTVIDATGGANL
jgi:3-oxoacyl-[acyl-carrier protein] reductase